MNKYKKILPPTDIIFEKITGNYTLKLARFTDHPEDLFLHIKDDLSKDEIEYFRKIRNNKRKVEWLGTRILLKSILGKYTRIYYDDKGNPFLNESRHISITHSENYAGIILGKNKNIGIDTEFISERILRTAHKFIPEKDLKSPVKENALEEIYMHWCGKEVLFKIKGGGGYNFKKDFIIDPFRIKNSGKINAFITKSGKEQFELSYRFIHRDNTKLLIVWYA